MLVRLALWRLVRVFAVVLGDNERLSRINLYATVHTRPIPRTSSQKET
jgi:hypothetical protein